MGCDHKFVDSKYDQEKLLRTRRAIQTYLHTNLDGEAGLDEDAERFALDAYGVPELAARADALEAALRRAVAALENGTRTDVASDEAVEREMDAAAAAGRKLLDG